MALPTSVLGMGAIQTEFGGSNPIALSEYYGVNANVASSGQIRMASFLGISALGANLTTYILYDMALSPTDATVSAFIYANGTYARKEGGSTTNVGTWKQGGTGSNYDVRFLKTSGTNPTSGDSINVWHVLSSDRSWTLTESTNGFASKVNGGRLEIRLNASPQTVFTNVSMTMTVEVEV